MAQFIKKQWAVNPACAGMIPCAATAAASGSCKPRVCGDDPTGRSPLTVPRE